MPRHGGGASNLRSLSREDWCVCREITAADYQGILHVAGDGAVCPVGWACVVVTEPGGSVHVYVVEHVRVGQLHAGAVWS